MLMKVLFLPVRLLTKPILLLMEYLFRGEQQQRTDEEQQRVDEATRSMVLYQFRGCPFCVKVRRAIYRINLTIETRNANEEARFKAELVTGGGRYQTPCLRIEEGGEVRWLYESNDIIAYLDQQFGVC